MRLRAIPDSDRWRLTCLRSENWWQEFLAAWLAIAGDFASYGIDNMIDVAGRADDDILAECWDVVAPLVDSAMAVINARTPMPSCEVHRVFQVLQGARIIYPDGGVHAMALARLNRSEELVDLADIAESATSTVRAMEAQDKIQKRKK